jgi:hypothetical protein
VVVRDMSIWANTTGHPTLTFHSTMISPTLVMYYDFINYLPIRLTKPQKRLTTSRPRATTAYSVIALTSKPSLRPFLGKIRLSLPITRMPPDIIPSRVDLDSMSLARPRPQPLLARQRYPCRLLVVDMWYSRDLFGMRDLVLPMIVQHSLLRFLPVDGSAVDVSTAWRVEHSVRVAVALGIAAAAQNADYLAAREVRSGAEVVRFAGAHEASLPSLWSDELSGRRLDLVLLRIEGVTRSWVSV